MFQPRSNMYLICVTVGLVLLASKYRNNVFQSVKRFRHSIRNKSNKYDDKTEFKVSMDKIFLVDSPEKCDYAVQHIRSNLSGGILGFDCEWVNEGPVSLLQLATSNGVCALFRICKIGYIPTKLKELLANKRILKVGVASFEDGQKILKDYGCRVSGTLDLRILAERALLPCPKSLAAMSLEYLGVEMDKIVEVRCGDWDASTLTDEQVVYAACDAIASVFIYHQIMRRMKEKHSIWQNIVMYVKSIWEKDESMRFHDIPSGVIDARFKARRTNTCNSNEDNNNTSRSKSNIIKNNTNKAQHATYWNNAPTRNKPLYHNCYLQAPDGDVLCTCDRKKAEWYVKKELGKIVKDSPLTVRLNFEPSGRALGDVGQYYTQMKVNQCVVCGASNEYVRKNVVPKEYRKYFPLVMKAHQSHDILLLCPPCHEISNSHDLQLRRKLADMCDAPFLGPLSYVRNNWRNNWRKLHSAVKALRERSTLPPKRRSELERYVLECSGQAEITPMLLDLLNDKLKNTSIPTNVYAEGNYQPHGLKVVDFFQKMEGGLVELERMWREHFLFTMKPKYLPSLWSVNHNQERLTIRQSQNRIEPHDAKIAGLS